MLSSLWESLQSVFEWSESFADSPWFYILIFAIAMIDGFFPIVPGETTVIIGGVSAGAGDLNILLVILAGALGAIAGDTVSYSIGRFGSNRFPDFFAKRATRIEKTSRQIRERGGLLLITARFIPGGRTVLTPRVWCYPPALRGVVCSMGYRRRLYLGDLRRRPGLPLW